MACCRRGFAEPLRPPAHGHRRRPLVGSALNVAIVHYAEADAGNHGVVAALIGDLIDREAFALVEPLVKNLAVQRVCDEAALAVAWRFLLSRFASQYCRGLSGGARPRPSDAAGDPARGR